MSGRVLFTRCLQCQEPITLARNVARGQSIVCPECGEPAYVWQLTGRANRDAEPAPTEFSGTWEGARP